MFDFQLIVFLCPTKWSYTKEIVQKRKQKRFLNFKLEKMARHIFDYMLDCGPNRIFSVNSMLTKKWSKEKFTFNCEKKKKYILHLY